MTLKRDIFKILSNPLSKYVQDLLLKQLNSFIKFHKTNIFLEGNFFFFFIREISSLDMCVMNE